MNMKELSTLLGQATLDAAARNEARKQAPSYPAWLAEVKDNLRHGDNSPCANAIRRSNGEMRTVDHLWRQVLDETA